MKPEMKWIALLLSAIVIFAAGVKWGSRLTGSDEDKSVASDSARANREAAESVEEKPNKRHAPETKQPSAANAAQQQIIRNLHEAMTLPKETRTRPLLKALEETTKVPLRKDLLEMMGSILAEGELESSQYVLSLMEQREEKASVEFLLNAAKHQNQDVSDRALFALEAVAGTVFKDREEAENWAATWKPDPEREKLFAPVAETEEESPGLTDLRAPGPRSSAPKKSGLETE